MGFTTFYPEQCEKKKRERFNEQKSHEKGAGIHTKRPMSSKQSIKSNISIKEKGEKRSVAQMESLGGTYDFKNDKSIDVMSTSTKHNAKRVQSAASVKSSQRGTKIPGFLRRKLIEQINQMEDEEIIKMQKQIGVDEDAAEVLSQGKQHPLTLSEDAEEERDDVVSLRTSISHASSATGSVRSSRTYVSRLQS